MTSSTIRSLPKRQSSGAIKVPPPVLDVSIAQRLHTLQAECRRHQFLEQADRLAQRQRDLDAPLLVMVVGEGNFGKSTLLNALVGKPVAPVSKLPKTWKVDLYESCHGQAEEARLYWRSNPDRPQRLSIADACGVCEEEENSARSHSEPGQSWKSDLFQVHWRVDAPWPRANVALVDTPGFSQLRADTSVQNINLYGSRGIQFTASDAFEYYYYRADIVLWCMKATKLQDEDTLAALTAVGSQEKKIIGVLTHMDRVPQERWEEIRREALRLYGEYVPEFVFTAAGAKNELREQTIGRLRGLLQERFLNSASSIKEQAIRTHYSDEAVFFAQSIDRIMACYLANCETRASLRDCANDIVAKHFETAEREITSAWESATSSASSKLGRLWDQSGEDKKKFGNLVSSNALDQNALRRKIQQIVSGTVHGVQAEVLALLERTEWDGVRLGGYSLTPVSEVNFPVVLDGAHELTIGSLSGSVSEHQAAAERKAQEEADQFAQISPLAIVFALPVVAVAALFGWLTGQERKEAIETARKGIEEFCSKNMEAIASRIASMRAKVLEQVQESIESSFVDHHGKGVPQVLEHALQADTSLNLVGQYPASREPVGLVGSKVNIHHPLSWYYYPLLKYGSEAAKRRWDEAVVEEWRSELARVLEGALVETGVFSAVDLRALRERHQAAVKEHVIQVMKAAPWGDAARGVTFEGADVLAAAGVERSLLQSLPHFETAIGAADVWRLEALRCFSQPVIKLSVSNHYENTLKNLVMEQVGRSPKACFTLNRFGWQTALCGIALGCGVADQTHSLPLVDAAGYYAGTLHRAPVLVMHWNPVIELIDAAGSSLLGVGAAGVVVGLAACVMSYRRLNKNAEEYATTTLDDLCKRLQAEASCRARRGLDLEL